MKVFWFVAPHKPYGSQLKDYSDIRNRVMDYSTYVGMRVDREIEKDKFVNSKLKICKFEFTNLKVKDKMGIKDLSKFLRDRKINCYVENYALSNLKGYRVGIDANNFLFVQGAGIHKDAVYKSNNLVDGELG